MVESEAHLQHVHYSHTTVEAVVRSVNIEKFLMGRKAHCETNEVLHSHQDERIRWDFFAQADVGYRYSCKHMLRLCNL